MHTQRPTPAEYGDYFGTYVDQVPDGDVLDALECQLDETTACLWGIEEQRGNYRYAEGKWSIKEIVGHLLDGERVFAYRALWIARGDTQALPGFEQDDYVRVANFDARTLASLIEEYEVVRRSSLALFAGLDEVAWSRSGSAAGSNVSVRAMAWIIAGHELHHLRVIAEHYLED